MKQRMIWIGVGSLAVLTAAFLLNGGQPVRQLRAVVGGAAAVAYAQPRSTFAISPGPPQPRVSPAEAGVDAAGLAAAVEYAGPRNTRALLVGRGGHIVFEKYWGDTAADRALDASGFTPVLAALLTGVALNERALTNLDAPLSNYLSEWKDDPRGAITLRQLMAGDSGLASAAGRPWPRTLAALYHVGGDLETALLGWPLDGAQRPGGSSADIDAEVLAVVLMRTLKPKQPYGGLIAQYLWGPLGAGEFSLGRGDSGGAAVHFRAGCCLRARIGDWMRVGELLANDGVFEGNQFAPPRFVSLMLKPAREQSGRGFFTHVGGAFAARDVAWLEADGKQRLWVVPSLRLVILRVGDEPPSNQGWDEAMIPDSIIRGTSGWAPASVGEGVDPKKFAPH